jgi:OCT family organic cation transporter-like MFS transporter 4/5
MNATLSVVSEYNLICQRSYLIQLANSVTFVGCLLGAGSFGWLCDAIGRKRPLFIATLTITGATLVSIAAPSYPMLALCRALVGAGVAGQTLAVFLLATESVGPCWRGRASLACLIFFVVGEFVLVSLAAALPAWRSISLAAGLANAAALLLYPFIEESPRWLWSRGRYKEARFILQSLAAKNGTSMPKDPAGPNTAIVESTGLTSCAQATPMDSRDVSQIKTTEQMRPADVLKRPQMLFNSWALALVWFTSMATWYGISLGAGGIPGSM